LIQKYSIQQFYVPHCLHKTVIYIKGIAEMRIFMKITEKKKPVQTIPKGVWESSNPIKEKEKENTSSKTTDLQGNGYPSNKRVQN